MAEIKANLTMDLKGLKCPMPLVKMSQQVKKMKIGEVVVAEVTDPGAHADFPSWAKTSGNQILDTVKEGDVTKFYIKKLK